MCKDKTNLLKEKVEVSPNYEFRHRLHRNHGGSRGLHGRKPCGLCNLCLRNGEGGWLLDIYILYGESIYQ